MREKERAAGYVEHDLTRASAKFVTVDVQEAAYYELHGCPAVLRVESGRPWWEFEHTGELRRLHRRYLDDPLMLRLAQTVRRLKGEMRNAMRAGGTTQNGDNKWEASSTPKDSPPQITSAR